MLNGSVKTPNQEGQIPSPRAATRPCLSPVDSHSWFQLLFPPGPEMPSVMAEPLQAVISPKSPLVFQGKSICHRSQKRFSQTQ